MPLPPSLPRAADAAPAALVLTATLLAYANALEAGFQFDDWDVIVRDPRVQSFAAWWASMPGIRPLLKLSYAANHASGLGAVGFHAVNLAVHAVNALLVLALTRRLAARHRPGDESPRWIAVGTALAFALHPVQTEAVSYASGRSSSLSTAFALASLLVWANAWARSGCRRATRARTGERESGHVPDRASGTGPARRRSGGLLGIPLLPLAGSLLAMLAAVATKESAVFVPALIVLWVATEPAPAPSSGSHARLRAALRASAAHWLVLIACLAAALCLPAYRALAATSLATRGPLENLVAQLRGIAWLLGQLVRFDRLNADPALEPVTRLDATGAWIAATLVLVVATAIAGRRRAPLAAFAVLWTVIAWLPTNSFVARLDLVNDRQWYAALLGPALVVGTVIGAIATGIRAPLAGSGRADEADAPATHAALAPIALLAPDAARAMRVARLRRGLAALLVASLSLGLAVATHRRNAVYLDELAFWLDVVRKSPGNPRAFNNLGLALAERCELDAAAAAWRRALELDPDLARAGVNLRLLLEGAAWAKACAAPRGAERGSAGTTGHEAKRGTQGGIGGETERAARDEAEGGAL